MIQPSSMTPLEIRQQGLQVLVEGLGALGMVRFLHQFELGEGDYSKQRHELLADVTLSDVMKQIRQSRS